MHSLRALLTAGGGDEGVTPSVLREMYNIGAASGKAAGNKQAAMGFLQQYVLPSDTQARGRARAQRRLQLRRCVACLFVCLYLFDCVLVSSLVRSSVS